MNLLEKLSVRKRITALVTLSLLIISGSALFQFTQYENVSTMLDNLYRHPVTVSRAVKDIEFNIVLIHREMKDIALGKDIEIAQSIVNRLHNETLAKFKILEERFLGDLTEIEKLKKRFIDWESIRQKVINYRLAGEQEKAYDITRIEGVEQINQLTELTQGILRFADSKLEQFYGDAKNTAKNSESIIIVTVVISLILFITINLLIGVSIISPLNKLSLFSKQLAEGNLDTDMTVEHENEIDRLGREMLTMRDNLKRLIYHIEITREKLIESEKLAALGGLVAGVAHEVNTPLGISITATSVVKEITKELNQEFDQQILTTESFSRHMTRMTESINMLEENLNRGTRLIRDFKLTAVDQVSESRCDFNVHKILRALIASLHPETRKIPVIPHVSGDEDITMDSYPGVLTQIISNLIMNSVIHAFSQQPEPRIQLSYRAEGNNIIFEYSDNGIGIIRNLHKKVFEPFYTTKKGQGGSGLGLNIVQGLIQDKLKGQMSFDSKPGDGVHFTFILPAKLPVENGTETSNQEINS